MLYSITLVIFVFFVLQHCHCFHSITRRTPLFRTHLNCQMKNFVKFQGLGNDFILVDNRESPSPMYTPDQAVKLCDRNFGVGGDGLIFVLPGENKCDFTMRIYNSDGSEPQMCGNGIRCMAKFIQELENKTDEEVSYDIWTKAGKISPVVDKNGNIRVDMGEPILEAAKVPTLLAPTQDGTVVDGEITVGGKVYKTSAISMGNPHSIMFVDSFETMDPPFPVLGPMVEGHPEFPERVNAEFVQVISPTHLKMKVWERGAGPTLACGTGACAVVVAAVLSKRSERDCKVSLPGGDFVY